MHRLAAAALLLASLSTARAAPAADWPFALAEDGICPPMPAAIVQAFVEGTSECGRGALSGALPPNAFCLLGAAAAAPTAACLGPFLPCPCPLTRTPCSPPRCPSSSAPEQGQLRQPGLPPEPPPRAP